MKLSNTTNPRSGQPFTVEQISKGATAHGLTWKADNSSDPKLSAALTDAATQIGWSKPNETLKLAVKIQSVKQLESGVRYHAMSVWVDGVRRDDLDSYKISQLTGRIGDASTGRIENPDMTAVEDCKIIPTGSPSKTTQTWDDANSETPNQH